MTHEHQWINCEICNAKIRQSSLKQHILKAHDEKKFECGICNFRTADKRYLKIHISSQHLNGIADLYNCPICEKTFTLKGSLPKHIKIVHGEQITKDLKCHICEFSTSNTGNLNQHIKTVHVRAFDNQCPFDKCTSKFNTKEALKRHKAAAHDGLKFNCQSCTYKTTQEGHLRTHIKRIHLKSENDTIVCNFCDKELTSLNGMKSHIKKAHKGFKGKCKYCDYEAAEASISRHVKTVHKQIRFYCDICDYQATRQSHLKSHTDSVHLRLTFKCEKCNSTFTHKDRLRRHTKIKHEKSIKLKDYNCPICPFRSIYKVSLQKHKESTHEGKRFKCVECGLSFTSTNGLKIHVSVVHRKERKYCPYCKSLLYSKDFDDHVEKKHKYYEKCNGCDYKSLSKRNLDRHMKLMHDGKERPFKCSKCPYQASHELAISKHQKLFHIGSETKKSGAGNSK